MDSEKRKEFKMLAIVVAIYLVAVVIGISVRGCSGGINQYIGTWKKGNTIIRIEEKPEKEIKKSLTLRDGSTANLLMPVRVRAVRGTSLWLMTREGIYEVDGKHALIIFCDICRLYVIFGLRREGDDLSIGIPRHPAGYKDKSVHDAMWEHGQTQSMFHYSNMDWVTYVPVPDEQFR
jgi:hypothetical protein